METIDELIDLLTLDKIGENLYQGSNYKTPWKRVFGGQVLGQALHAAYQTVPQIDWLIPCTDILFWLEI